MNTLLRWRNWSVATMTRFVWIWGVGIFGGLTIILGYDDLHPYVDRAIVFIAIKLVAGAIWGVLMWFVVQWLKKRRRSK